MVAAIQPAAPVVSALKPSPPTTSFAETTGFVSAGQPPPRTTHLRASKPSAEQPTGARQCPLPPLTASAQASKQRPPTAPAAIGICRSTRASTIMMKQQQAQPASQLPLRSPIVQHKSNLRPLINSGM